VSDHATSRARSQESSVEVRMEEGVAVRRFATKDCPALHDSPELTPMPRRDHPSAPVGRPRDPAIDEAILVATRRRLVRDGYSQMSIGVIASDAQVTRPTLYRRWTNKFDLVVGALDDGFRQQVTVDDVDLSSLSPKDALLEAVRRLDPAHADPDAIVLMSNVACESRRTPELLDVLRTHAVEPPLELMESVLSRLRDAGHIRADADHHMIATMCFGAYFAAFYSGELKDSIPDRVVSVIWPAIVAVTSS
jgi:AcrR family transcriptional regulator